MERPPPVPAAVSHGCPCCGSILLDCEAPCSYDICPVCWWEDDPVQSAEPAMSGGANAVSLETARWNFLVLGACAPEYLERVRPPLPEEQPATHGHVLVCTLEEEPRGPAWQALLAHARTVCETFLLVERRDLGLGDDARALVARLSPWLLREQTASAWPGTRLLGGSATVRLCRLTDESVTAIGGATEGLFEWRQPERLEDLCLLSQGRPWLVSIAHEEDAYLVLTPQVLARLRQALPRLALCIDAPGAEEG